MLTAVISKKNVIYGVLSDALTTMADQ